MSTDSKLLDAATALTTHVDGIDWDARAVDADIQTILKAVDKASPAGRAAAMDTLVARLRRARLEDADGVAHVAITAGTLVEHGAPAAPLAEVLLEALPGVLESARRYADRCLADLPPPRDDEDDDDDDDEDEAEPFLEVDGRALTLDVFRAHVAADRPGACSLHRLTQWVLPTIASLTRDRDSLRRACADAELRRRAAAMARSDANWLHVLLRAPLDARWLAVVPLVERGFRIVVDGVASNFDLHTLVADALIERGVPGTRPPAKLVAYLAGRAPTSGASYVTGVWNYYDWRAVACDLASPNSVPLERWVWNEGHPADVPTFDDVPTLVIGPPALERTWNVGRTFGALAATVRVEDELAPDDVRARLARMRDAARE